MSSSSTARTARLVATTLIAAASCLAVAAASAPAASAASLAVTHAVASASTGDTTPWGSPGSGAPSPVA